MALNAFLPDNNANGFATAIAVGGLSGSISHVTVSLDITGGFNGDLYAFLVGPNGGFAVLLNRTGLSAGNAFGYSDSGFNITLSDAAANGNIHTYQSVPGYATLISNGSIWAPDGRNIDPQSSGSVFDSALATATLSSFVGNAPNGMWNLFIADLSPAGQSTLVSVGLNIITVPEPQTGVLLGLAALFGIYGLRNKFRRPNCG